MPSLSDNIDFSLLSNQELEQILAEEREKRRHLAPARKIINKGKVAGEQKKTTRALPADVEEVELD